MNHRIIDQHRVETLVLFASLLEWKYPMVPWYPRSTQINWSSIATNCIHIFFFFRVEVQAQSAETSEPIPY